MKFTTNWLQEYVNLDGLTTEDLAEKLTMLGLEVEAVIPLFQELSALKTARILSTTPHPNADQLTCCQVEVGTKTYQVICGAPNVRENLVVVIALPGTVLPGKVKIKRAKVRGVESHGMLCSEQELGLSDEHTGILELPPDLESGLPFLEATGLNDTQIEVDLTPNRPDCASVIGIAREVAGITGKSLRIPVSDSCFTTTSPSFTVAVESPELCPRYAGKLITGVTIGPSPWWLKKRLLSIGQRPINNVVDITNLVMMEYGQPLHAFDFDTLADQKIIVRTPHDHETTFTTLDNVTRTLGADTLLICDGKGPVAVAGVMGGRDSEVTEKTINVLLESACFNHRSIRQTARLLNLPSEASYRFERGVDPGGTLNAMERAATLICTIAGGTAEPGGIDNYQGGQPVNKITLRISRASELLGIPLSRNQVAERLDSIEIRCQAKDADTLWVTPPTFRMDLEREVDLVEEVARLIGYDEIPVTLPQVDLHLPEQEPARIKRTIVTEHLIANGFFEAINYSFYASRYPDDLALTRDDDRFEHVKLRNPLSEDQDVMRTSLLPGLLENVRRNLNFQQPAGKLFEVGKIFRPNPEHSLPDEKTRLSGVLFGNRHGSNPPIHFPTEAVDIFDAKGIVESLLERLRLYGKDIDTGIKLVPVRFGDGGRGEPFAHDFRSIELTYQDKRIGTMGMIQPQVCSRFSIKREVYYFDLDFDLLCAIGPVPKTFSALPVYPAVKRDISLVVPANTAAGKLVETVLSSKEKLLERCEVFDIYRGEKVSKNQKSVSLSITYRSKTKTLTEKNVEKAHNKLVQLLSETYGATLREA